jgi:hypothetical protein
VAIDNIYGARKRGQDRRDSGITVLEGPDFQRRGTATLCRSGIAVRLPLFISLKPDV